MTARDRIICGIMKWAYANARRCGMSAIEASAEAAKAAEFVKERMARP